MSKKANKNGLESRMRTYEAVAKGRLTRRTPIIIRLDGKAFHSFTRGFERPFDSLFRKTMNETMRSLCESIQGCVLGYTQSDEISLVLVDYQTLTSDAWFDNEIQKMCSIAASMATLAFNDLWRRNVELAGSENPVYAKRINTAMFDARVFNLPKEEVLNYLVYRQQDATRNSIQSAGQAYFSRKELLRKTNDVIQDMLFTQKGVNWNNYPAAYKRGVCCVRKLIETPVSPKAPEGAKPGQRPKWVLDMEIPIFNRDPDYINKLVFLS